ncbi:MAG TPA: PAS domain S-box protein, partial [Conexibacter sp.]|nr:PAS domain S-box protein [Conexibacter sp.]
MSRRAAERDRLSAELRAAELRHRLLAENATDTILAFGPDGRITYVSPASNELIGYPPEEIVGRQPHAFVHPDDRRSVTRARARIGAEGDTITVTSRLRHRAGHYVWIEARVRRVLDPKTGVPVEGQAIVRDVSERVAAEA